MTCRAPARIALAMILSLAACGGGSSGEPAPECAIASTCPAPEGRCLVATCVAGRCAFAPVAAGSLVDGAGAGDCTNEVCDGAGAIVAAADDGDVPLDGNGCTQDLCSAGTSSNPPEPAGTPCTQGGGVVCDGAGTCVECNSDADCTSGVCSNHACQPPTCFDGVRNGPESDVDCGGTCIGCGDGKACSAAADCVSKVCAAGVCAAASCPDGVKNGGETDVDCGGGTCTLACHAGQACASGNDCTIGMCSEGKCQLLVTQATPADGAVGISITTNVSITFSDPVDLPSISSDTSCVGSVQLSADSWATCVRFATVADAGNDTINLTPAQPLAWATAYRLRLGAGVTSTGGGSLVPYAMAIGFTTENAPPPPTP